MAASIVLAVTFVFGAYFSDLYAQLRVRSNAVLFSRIMTILGAALICASASSYFNPNLALPNQAVFTGSVSALIVLTAWRALYSRGVTATIGAQKILFVGSSPLMITISEQLHERPELGIKAVGHFAETLPNETNSPPVPCLGDVGDITATVLRTRPDRVVIAMTEKRASLPTDELLRLRFSGVRVERATTLYEEAFGRICVREVCPSELIFSSHLGPRRWKVRLLSTE